MNVEQFKCKEYKNIVLNRKIKFLFVGRLESAKGLFYLVETFKRLKEYEIELDIVGGISSKDKEILEDIDKSNNIVYYGIKQKKDMNKVYQEADVYIMASVFEGFSLSLFEAMASGIPVIATKNSAADGIIKNYKQGFVIKAGSVEEIQEKVLWFYNNREKIPDMGKAARKLAEKYTWDNYKKRLSCEVKKII